MSVMQWIWRICMLHILFTLDAAFGFVNRVNYRDIAHKPLLHTRASVSGHKSARLMHAKRSLEDMLGAGGWSMLSQHLGAENDAEDEKQMAKKEKRQLKKEKLKSRKATQEMLGSKPKDAMNAGADIGEEETHEELEENVDKMVENGEGTNAAETKEQRLRRERPSRVRFAASSAQPNFVSLKLESVAVAFGDQEVLQDASWDVKTGERVGLVGGNGSGKTSMMRILEGRLEATAGDVIKSSKGLKIAVLRQEFVDELVMDRTLKAELLSVFEKEHDVAEELAEVQKKLDAVGDDAASRKDFVSRLNQLQKTSAELRVDAVNAKAERIMATMGFSSEDSSRLVRTFSGGWKMRIALAKVLLQDPNIVMLDEPTNHLDLDSVEWLEDFLINQKIPIVTISHDREFLNRVSNKIVEVAGGRTFTYNGDYNTYVKQREEKFHAWNKQYDQQQRRIQEDTTYINKNRNKKEKMAAVKQKEKALELLMKSSELIPAPPKDLKFRFRFPPSPRCKSSLLSLSDVGHGYGDSGRDSTLFSGVNLDLAKGERVGIVGPNGCGKSTLLRIAAGLETPRTGQAAFLSNNVAVGYFAQSQADALDLDRSVVQAMQDIASDEHEYTELRNLLGQFRFGADFVDKPVRLLSGGEKARLAICRLLLTSANLLILDEPTNHLDVTAREILEDAIRHYDGAVLLVSHDRYFMSQVATKIYSFENGELMEYGGDYHHYLSNKPRLQDRTQSRYVDGSAGIRPVRPPAVVDMEDSKRKSFGGQGPSGRRDQGIKNARRFS